MSQEPDTAPEQPVYGFHHLNRAWYAEHARGNTVIDEVIFGLKRRSGGSVHGEMIASWALVGGKATPQLIAYADSWVLFTHPPVAAALKSLSEITDQEITPDQFCKVLLDAGFVDLTETTRPPQ